MLVLCSPEQAATGPLVADALGVKKTGRDPRVLSVSVVHDPELTLTLPVPSTGRGCAGPCWAPRRCRCTTSSAMPSVARWTCRRPPPAVLGLGADPARSLWHLAGELGAPRSLAGLGMAEDDVDVVADQVLAGPYANSRGVTRDGVTALLHRAWAGEPPTAWPGCDEGPDSEESGPSRW